MPIINHRELSVFAPIQDELTLDLTKNYLFDLSYMGCMHLTGENSREFLQGQLSCDVREVTSTQMRQGAMCNLKGRVLALLDVIDWNGLHLFVPQDLLLPTQTSLAKTAFFSKVQLTLSPTYQLFGFYLQNNNDIIPFNAQLPLEQYGCLQEDAFYVYHLGEGFYIFIVKNDTISASFINNNQWRGSLTWHTLQLKNNRWDIYPLSRGAFLPHRLSLQLSGYLSFNKGCYKGQEIVARTHYRAKLKHEMKLFIVENNMKLTSGSRLMSEDGQTELGELVDYSVINETTALIAASVVFNCPTTFIIENVDGDI